MTREPSQQFNQGRQASAGFSNSSQTAQLQSPQYGSAQTREGGGTNENDLVITPGQLTKLGEGNDAQTKYIHWPHTDKSGVTLGKGYDIGSRSENQVVSELLAAGMGREQAVKISKGAGKKGQEANNFVRRHKNDIGEIDTSVQYALLSTMLEKYKGDAKAVATSTTAKKDRNGYYTNARGREVKDGAKAGTYVLSAAQWDNLHPAMVELLTDLKYQGGYYLYQRVASINKRLIENDGNHLAQFKSLLPLFEVSRGLSPMDKYGTRIGEAKGNKSTFYNQSSEDLQGASTRRNRIRLAYIKHIISALENGGNVTMQGGNSSDTQQEPQTNSGESTSPTNTNSSSSESSSSGNNNSDPSKAIGKGVVKASSLNVRKGPGTNNSILFPLSKGTEVKIYSKEGNWLMIGANQWVHGNYVEQTETPQSPTAKGSVNVPRLNVREGAGTNFKRLRVITKGTEVEIFEESGDWLRIGENQWIHGDYVTKGSASSTESASVSASSLNVRKGPGTQFDKIKSIPQGTKVEIIKREGDWAQIGDGQWVHGGFLSTGNQQSTQTSGDNNPTTPRKEGFDIDAAVNTLNSNATARSRGLCALYVRYALDAGGLKTAGHRGNANAYFRNLPALGFTAVNTTTYQKGDIVVFDKIGKHKYGHIAMWNGSQWVSDFRQRNIIVANAYRSARQQVYRWQ